MSAFSACKYFLMALLQPHDFALPAVCRNMCGVRQVLCMLNCSPHTDSIYNETRMLLLYLPTIFHCTAISRIDAWNPHTIINV